MCVFSLPKRIVGEGNVKPHLTLAILEQIQMGNILNPCRPCFPDDLARLRSMGSIEIAFVVLDLATRCLEFRIDAHLLPLLKLTEY